MKRSREEEAVVAWVEEEHRKQGTSGDLDHISAGADGLFTNRKSDRAGAKILSVPLSCMLTAEKAVDSPLGVAFSQFAPSTPPEHLLWLFMAQARRWPGHFFHIFMQSLNTNAPDPANWVIAERDELRDTILYPILLKVDEEMGELCETVAKFAAAHPEHHLDGLTKEELIWARGHHRSRRFADAINPHSRNYNRGAAVTGASQVKENGMGVMVPLMDKTNHNPAVKVSWRIESDGKEVAYHVEEDVDHTANKGEVFNNYGPKSNEQLLLDFGFALPSNPFDGVSLTLCVGDGNGGVKRLGPFQVRRPSERWPTFPRQLWCALADPVNAQPGQADEAEGAEGADGGGNVDIGIDEIEMLQAQLAHRLKLLSGTEKADAKVLGGDNSKKKAAAPVSMNRKFVALYRDGQREVLRAALEELEEMMGAVAGEEGEEMEEMEEEDEE